MADYSIISENDKQLADETVKHLSEKELYYPTI
jgi:hypothetical protein